MKFKLNKPCSECPYTPTGLKGLLPERCKELWDYTKNKTFACHKTTEENTGKYNTEQQCVGALLVERQQGYNNNMFILAERLGIYDPSKILSTTLYPSLKAMIKGHNPNLKFKKEIK